MENQYNYYDSEESQPNMSGYNYDDGDNKPKKKRKIPKILLIIGVAVLFGIVSSATFLLCNKLGSKLLGMNEKSALKTTNTEQNTSLSKSVKAVTSDVSNIVEDVMPSVVSITNLSVQQVKDFFFGTYEQEAESAGTGIIVAQNDDELLIVTNNHVVTGSEKLTVTFADNSSVSANIKGTDVPHDIAVIAVPLEELEQGTKDAIAVATLGDSSKLKIGEPAIAIGNAFGHGQSVTTGVISAKEREISTQDPETGQTVKSSVKLLQTSAAINHGNSGGPLVNAAGQVIGINSSKLEGSSVEGVGYAIPISDVSELIKDLMNQETKTKLSEEERGYIGISGVNVTDEYAELFNMPYGVFIKEVQDKSGAKEAGMKDGEVIVKLNASTIDSMATLQEELKYHAAGEKVKITVKTPESAGKYKEKVYEVTLGKKPE